MSGKHNQDVLRRVIEEGFNRGDYGALDECFASHYAERQFGLSSDLAGFKGDIAGLRRAFPDLHLTIEEMAADGDKVWARSTARGTHLGPFMGLPATGRAFEIAVVDICRFAGGRIVEHWGVPDRFALMQQLGLVPDRRPAPAG